MALLRRGEDGGHLADTGHRHLQRAGDRGGAHGEHVHVGAQCLDVLLVLHAEPLLLVDHHQAEVLPAHPGLQQPVGAHHHVHAAVGEALQDLLCLLLIGEAGQALHGDGEALHAVLEGLQVLLGEQRGGHENSHLLAVLHGLEGGTHGDLGLAVAHVADHHAVHRDRLLHIGLHIADHRHLVHGLGEREGVLHLALPRGVGGEGVAGRGVAGGVQLDQLARDLADGLARLALGVLPVAAAHFGQRGHLAAHVARELVERFHRHEELVARLAAFAGGVFDHQVLAARAGHGALDHLDELADAVFVVHHEVACGQRERVDLVAPLGRKPSPVAHAGHPVTGEIGLGEQDEGARGHGDAGLQAAAQHADGAGARLIAGLQFGGGDLRIAEAFEDAGAGSLARHHDHAAASRCRVGSQAGEQLLRLGLRAARCGCVLDVHGEVIVVVRVRSRGERGDGPPRMSLCGNGFVHLVEAAVGARAEVDAGGVERRR
ncbi:hypothetical protein TSST111916_21210 [Tsukamurella strandjordii]